MTLKLFGFALILSFVGVAQAADKGLSIKRDRVMVNQVLDRTISERAGVEREYKKNDVRPKSDRGSLRAVNLEIGDEIGGGGGGNDYGNVRDNDHGYREKSVSRKLDREWKDVNSDFRKVEPPGFSRSGRKL